MVLGVWRWANDRRRTGSLDAILVISTILLGTLSAGYVAMMILSNRNSGNLKLFLPGWLVLVLMGSMLTAFRLMGDWPDAGRRGRQRNATGDEVASSLAVLWVTLVFLVGASLFCRLASQQNAASPREIFPTETIRTSRVSRSRELR